ncbi:LacI family DNA-binding transcriptional regulator [Prauserella rugosa]|uniref:LacI family transcriptional regulator n=1 Tax=Prauserella rugosa TaxID=43354 RepID=A0A660CBA2_9PSEU|nr:LacI family DNA-binding transcriptional regulator [Prauserella rugosa]KMS88104.1 LacI family transcriptional regulator [Streptomyces regensis]TWH18789.1 LacI family transcriptional regulator [Prauserella rugosa]
MITINDVAAHAGVSTATVSRVLNGKSTVDQQLADRVLVAAKELGYRRNGLARNLRRQSTAVLALIISDVENPFFTAIARGVEDIAQEAGYSVVLCNSDDNADKEARYVDVAVSEQVAGVIVSPTTAEPNFAPLRDAGVPIVAVDRPVPGPPTDTVLVDSRLGARQATEHLLGQGYTTVACLTGPRGVPTADDRAAGHRDALRAAGLRAPAALTKRAEYRASGARSATVELFRGRTRPDAVLVANNAMAIGTLQALRELGLRPGSDVGVVTFDEAPWTTLIDPPLTVVAQPAYDIGSHAVRMMLDRIAEPDRDVRTTTLHTALVERASSVR